MHPLFPEFSFESEYESMTWISWSREHAEVPVFCVAAYLALVHRGPDYVPKAIPCRMMFALWNLCLSLFSLAGVLRVTPYLYDIIQEKGFKYTLCADPIEWYAHGAPGFWVWLFVYSKMPELLDTVFLVIQKKRVMFLHWFHHATVLLYCWHAYVHRIAPGIWFAVMNYWVHSIMYMYYFLMIFKINVAPIAIFITLGQLTQMIGGLYITGSAAYEDITNPGSCAMHPSNYKLGLGMYFAYFLLFADLFVQKYFGKKKPSNNNIKKPKEN